jgi:hypothetical protein
MSVVHLVFVAAKINNHPVKLIKLEVTFVALAYYYCDFSHIKKLL